MGQAAPLDEQARHRAELRRSHALRDGMLIGAATQGVGSILSGIAAWLGRSGEAKDPPSRPRSSAG